MRTAALVCGLIALGAAPRTLTEGRLVVLNKSDANVCLHDVLSGEKLVTLPVGEGPHEAATSPDGTLVVVCNYGDRAAGHSLTLIDAVARKVQSTIDLVDFHRPHGVLFLPGGKELLVTAEVEKKLLVVDLQEGKVAAAIDTGQELSHMVAASPDGKRAYVANIGSGSISIIDLEARKLLKALPTGAGAEGIAVQPVTGAVWVTNRSADTISVVDPTTLEVRQEIACGAFPIRVAFTPDGSRALVSCARADEVQIYDGSKGELVAKVSMTAPSVEDAERAGRLFGADSSAQAMPIGILVEPSGKLAFIANTMADIVTVIDIESAKVLRRLSTGRQPDGMAWVP
jgi:YVTN family beta-propeller protein